MRLSFKIAFGTLCLSQLVHGHTWVEQLMVIAPNGTMVGQPGFPRNNVLRSNPSFSDTAMVWLIPPNGRPVNQIDAGQMMCRPEQTTQHQTSDSPRLRAAPGQSVALRYQENGHVSLPQNQPGKPTGSGANFVYYTNDSKPDDLFLSIHRQWTTNGSGGDKRGRLISTQNFDDGQCYQVNGGTISKQRQIDFKHQANALQGADLWCQQDVQIPTDAKPGTTITLYWVWDWPTLPGTAGFPQGKQEIYTTCMDIDIAPSAGQGKVAGKGFVKQDLGNAAAASQFADISDPSAIKAQIIPFSGVSVASSPVSSVISTSSNVRTNSVVPIPASPSSTVLPTADTPDQVTITVQATVTATTFSTRTRKASQPTITVTDTETDLVTVFVTQTAANRQQITSSASPEQSTDCNTTNLVYRLRGRNPLYILPSDDQPSSSAGTGC